MLTELPVKTSIKTEKCCPYLKFNNKINNKKQIFKDQDCSNNAQFQKISISHHRRDRNFLRVGGGGCCETKNFKEMHEA